MTKLEFTFSLVAGGCELVVFYAFIVYVFTTTTKHRPMITVLNDYCSNGRMKNYSNT